MAFRDFFYLILTVFIVFITYSLLISGFLIIFIIGMIFVVSVGVYRMELYVLGVFIFSIIIYIPGLKFVFDKYNLGFFKIGKKLFYFLKSKLGFKFADEIK